jgi:ferredoxin
MPEERADVRIFPVVQYDCNARMNCGACATQQRDGKNENEVEAPGARPRPEPVI